MGKIKLHSRLLFGLMGSSYCIQIRASKSPVNFLTWKTSLVSSINFKLGSVSHYLMTDKENCNSFLGNKFKR